jgi:probable HAF family extracellular repeat protein
VSRILVLISFVLFNLGNTFAASQYYVTDIGDLPGGTNVSNGYGINNYGQVVGSSVGVDWENAFLWTPTTTNGVTGTLVNLGDFDGGLNQAAAYAINSRGQVVGYSNVEDGGRAFLWSPVAANGTDGTLTNLGVLNPTAHLSVALDINDRGQVTGYSNGAPRAFLWNPATPNSATGNMIDLGALSGGNGTSQGTAINNLGQVSGHSDAGPSTHAILWSPVTPNGSTGTMADIGNHISSGGTFAFNDEMNNGGSIAGHSVGDGGHAVVWVPTTPNSSTGTAIDLGGIGAEALGINDFGDIVGYKSSRATIWPKSGGNIDLNTLLDPISGAGWTLTDASAINEFGQIAGTGVHNGITHAFLLTPVPEPPAFIMLIGIIVTSAISHGWNRRR